MKETLSKDQESKLKSINEELEKLANQLIALIIKINTYEKANKDFNKELDTILKQIVKKNK